MMGAIHYQVRKHIVFITFMLMYLSLSACSDQETVSVENEANKKIDFASHDDFLLLKAQISTLENNITELNHGVATLNGHSTQLDKDINNIKSQLLSLNSNDDDTEITVNTLLFRLGKVESRIDNIESLRQQKKSTQASKRKQAKIRFNYRIVDVSQWGNRILVSIKMKHDFVFLAKGDVIGVWRLEHADIQTRQVVFKHSTTQKTISRVVL